MSIEKAVVVLPCEVCAQSCTEVDGGRDWIHLEVTRELPVEGAHWLSADFCTQAHAAEWLGRPLPERAAPGESVPTTWGDRVGAAVGLSVFFGVVGLFGLGTWTAVRFVIDLF